MAGNDQRRRECERGPGSLEPGGVYGVTLGEAFDYHRVTISARKGELLLMPSDRCTRQWNEEEHDSGCPPAKRIPRRKPASRSGIRTGQEGGDNERRMLTGALNDT